MAKGKTNKQLLQHMLVYIEQIEEANKMFNADKEALKNNSVYRNAVALCVLQIGELSNLLTEDFKEITKSEIPWKAVRGMRNILAHHYGKIDYESLWETISVDIPTLKEFCERHIRLFDALNEEADETESEDEIEQTGMSMNQ
ncbi:MAG: DUF86 domain-containing protein [Ruminococcus sp.]|nr:DUF86 domain-containing protein [Ruminococcus sp.]MBR1739060.1 DUF86 domain-containing protein [Ruminococcus sp.]